MENKNVDEHLKQLKEKVLSLKKLSNDDQKNELLETFDEIYESTIESSVSMQYRTFACDTLSIWISRFLQLDSKNSGYRDDFKHLLSKEKADVIFHYVIDFWNDSGAALGNALKELFIKMLSYLNVVLDSDAKDKIFTSWLETSLEMPYTMRAFYFMIEHLHKYVKPNDFILQKKPNFISDCLDNIWSRVLGSVIGKNVFLVLRYVYNADSEDEWMNLWQSQVMESLQNESLRKGVESYLLPNLFQVSKSCTIKFIKEIIKQNDTPILLSTLKVAQDNAILIEPFLEIDPSTNRPLIDIKQIQNLLQVNNASYRISAVQLLVSSPKLSKAIPTFTYQTIIKSLDMVFTDGSLETRNEIFSCFKRFIFRIKDSTYALHRDAQSLAKKNYEKFQVEIKDKVNSVEESKLFFQYLLNYIKHNLTSNSSYLRKEMAFKLLIVLIKSGLDSRVNKRNLEKSKVNFVYSLDIYSDSLLRLVIDNIMDNYDDIRTFASEIIAISPFKATDHVDMHLLENRALTMLCDIKGKEVDSGARFFQFAFNYYQNENDLKKCDQIVKLLLNRLDDSLNMAKKDITTACISYSNQGYFAAFKFIFETMDFKKCSNILKENDLFTKLISKSIEIWNIVQKILQHDSPEGILLEEFQNKYTSDLEAEYGKATQVILSYAWRSVKESSNMLDVMLKFKLSPITSKNILTIGPLLLEQLATIRHRGAFSSVYLTFISCCSVCTSRKDLQEIPKQWLDENLKLIQARSKYITRRSAGIPFLLTAILISNKELVGSTFKKLIEIAQLPVEELNADMNNINLPQVNAINCIKTIFTDASLSKESIYHVDEAFVLTLNSFASPHWSIRNCAVMLFTALQNRLFSSKKVKANYLTSYPARLFFEKFESIRELFLKALNDSVTNGLKDQSEIEKVFPILTIMCRLEPTPGYNGLDEFIPVITKILENKIWKVREMAARSLPSLIDSSVNFEKIINSLIENINLESKDYNKIHGSLLAIKEIILKFLELSSEESRKSAKKLFELDNDTRINFMKKCPMVLNDIKCYPIKLEYFQILNILKLNVTAEEEKNVKYELLSWFNNDNHLKIDGSKQLALKELSTLLFDLVEGDEEYSFIQNCLLSPLYEIQLSCISHYANKSKNYKLNQKVTQVLVKNIWKLLETDENTTWKYVKSQALKLLKKLIIESDASDSMETLAFHSNELLELLASETNEDIKLSTVEALASYIAKLMVYGSNKYESMYNKWMSMVEKMMDDELEFVIRISALKALTAFNEIYYVKGDNEHIKLQTTAFIFNFLTDADDKICELSSNHLNKVVLKINESEYSLPIITEKLMVGYFSQLNNGSLLEFLVTSKTLNFLDQDLKLEHLVASNSLLFAIEKSNTERNQIEKVKELIEIINKTELKNTKALKNLAIAVESNINDIIQFITENKIIDGCFGLFSDPNIFEFTYCQILLLKCLQQNQLIKEKFEDELVQYLKEEKIYCHPLILELL